MRSVLRIGSILHRHIGPNIECLEFPSAEDEVSHHGERVVQGQRLMQPQPDIFLGWTRMSGRDYLVRQLADHKAAIETQDLKGHGLTDYDKMCGEVLGKGRARTGDACVLDGYCGDVPKLDNAIATFAVAYADQSTADYERFINAVKRGRLSVA